MVCTLLPPEQRRANPFVCLDALRRAHYVGLHRSVISDNALGHEGEDGAFDKLVELLLGELSVVQSTARLVVRISGSSDQYQH